MVIISLFLWSCHVFTKLLYNVCIEFSKNCFIIEAQKFHHFGNNLLLSIHLLTFVFFSFSLMLFVNQFHEKSFWIIHLSRRWVLHWWAFFRFWCGEKTRIIYKPSGILLMIQNWVWVRLFVCLPLWLKWWQNSLVQSNLGSCKKYQYFLHIPEQLHLNH